MPKSFDEENLKFEFPDKLANEVPTISYSVDGNIITGYAKNITLTWGTSFDVMISFPDGYFIGATENVKIYEIIHTYYTPGIVSIFMLFTLISAVLCIRYCKNNNSTKLNLSKLINAVMMGIVVILVAIRPIYQLTSGRNTWISELIFLMIFPYLSFTRTSHIYNNKDIFK